MCTVKILISLDSKIKRPTCKAQRNLPKVLISLRKYQIILQGKNAFDKIKKHFRTII